MKSRCIPLLLFLHAACYVTILSQGVGAVWRSPITKRGCVGINYGRLGDNLPQPVTVASLIRELGACYVKIYDHDREVIMALAGAGLPMAITATNQELGELSSSTEAAERWVTANILSHNASSLIAMVMVGNEIYSAPGQAHLWPLLLPAMRNLQLALHRHAPTRFTKVTTSLAMDALASSYPPSSAKFRDDLAPYLAPLLAFLVQSGSYLFLDAYPFLAWQSDSVSIPFDYALLRRKEPLLADGACHYTHLLDAQIDATLAASAKLSYPGIKLALGETGWPTAGAYGASIDNAKLYTNLLVAKMTAGMGTPLRRNVHIPTFLFSLFNEDQKPGPDTERNWGLLYPNGMPVYETSLSWRGGPHVFEKQWCVAKNGEAGGLQGGINYACQNGASCEDIQKGGLCEQPDTLVSHASYAFNSYWQNMKKFGATCDFAGAAMLTYTNPSYGGCYYVYKDD